MDNKEHILKNMDKYDTRTAILIQGARMHNLKNITLLLPKGKFIVFTGPSGSGKSSMAFDTLYAEGQRRYVESLSAYARQFLELMPKPDVDSIQGVMPSISIEQKTTGKNPRSTVGTTTEIYDYLRLLFARVGTPYSPTTGLPIQAQTRHDMAQHIQSWPVGTRYALMAPFASGEKGEFKKEFQFLKQKGYSRVEVDGVFYEEIEDIPALHKNKRHDIRVLIDRLVVNPDEDTWTRLTGSLQEALDLAKGHVVVVPKEPKGAEVLFSSSLSCPVSGFSLPEIEPRLFSFNSPAGACPACNGLGVEGMTEMGNVDWTTLAACPKCHGARLKPESLCVRIKNQSIVDVCRQSISDLHIWIDDIEESLPEHHKKVAQRILKEIETRVHFLQDVGLGYLSLSRPSATLSGGESQRIRLASQVGSGLTGVLYVLDEPSIGLHQRDNARLLCTLKRLKDLGNTVVVVEHDEDAIRNADHIVDFGPGSGFYGGNICVQGTLDDILASSSLTGDYLSKRKTIPVPSVRRLPKSYLTLQGAHTHTLKNLTVEIPLGVLIGVTGVSGSGKSSLIMDTLLPALEKKPAAYETLEGTWQRVVSIDQSPIGRTPRSNPATYTGLFTPIREWYAHLPEARARGYTASRFSFNVKGGRCEPCQGEGKLHVSMHFLPDMTVSCPSCQGKRFSRDTLEILYKGKSIDDVLKMSIREARDFFDAMASISFPLSVLDDVGLGYVQLGQCATTLSGGEAQRVKLAKELARPARTPTFYILDEPTTGLHFQDVADLLKVLHTLVDKGHTVLVIEHNLEVLKTADWIIDLGPEGGAKGGHIVAQGTPEMVSCGPGHTGFYLKNVLS